MPLGQAVNKSSIFSQGKDLLFAFRRERNLNVPVIFIAYSLGGIILKEALTGSYHSGEKDLEDIARSTKAVVFMGTPHRGSKDIAGVGEVARRVASAFLIDTNKAMLDSLGLQNSDIERCQDSFTRIWQTVGFKIKTFQEGLPFSGINLGILEEKVVPDFSSLLGDPREHAETLQANHMEMCRFWGELDPNYRKVGGELRNIYGSILQTLHAPISEPQTSLEWYRHSDHQVKRESVSSGYQAARSLLFFPELGQRQHTIDMAFSGTCQRLLGSEQYKMWFNRQSLDKHQGLLWIKGKPGSGKSTIMKEAIRQACSLQTSHKYHILSFFFNAHGQRLEQTTTGFYRALLYQLLPGFQERMQGFIRYCTEPTTNDHRPALDEQGLKNDLRSLFFESCEDQVFIFVDALDECVGTIDGPRKIVEFLQQLSADATFAGFKLNICMSSRHYPLIGAANYVKLILEDYNQSDIALVVDKRISMAISADSSQDVHHWVDLKNEIIQRASGVFLWARLVLDVLLAEYDNGKSIRHLESRLSSVPPTLRDLYTQILQDIAPKELSETARFFSWLLLATRPLRPRECYHLLAFVGKSTPKSLAEWRCSDDAINDYDQLQKRIQRISRGLVEIHTYDQNVEENAVDDKVDSTRAAPGSFDIDSEGCGSIQFIHESVYQFFLHEGGFELLFPHAPEAALGKAHLSILNICFDYLAIKELDELVHGRLNVARTAIGSSCSSLVSSLVSAHPRFWKKSKRKTRWTKTFKPFHSNTSSVGSSASNSGGTFPFKEDPIEHRRPPPSSGTSSRSGNLSRTTIPPLVMRMRGMHQTATPPVATSSGAAYQSERIPRHVLGRDELVSSSGALSNTGTVANNIILQRFLTQSEENVSNPEEMLYSNTPSVQSQRKILDEIPCLLYYASDMIIPHIRYAEKAGLDPSGLLQHLQNEDRWSRWVSLRDDMSRQTSLLYFAAEHDLLSWASHLIGTGVDINTEGGNLKYPLIAAAYRANDKMLHLLLQNGADIGVRDQKGQTILHYLTSYNEYSLVKLILEEYVQPHASTVINARSFSGRTPLHLAASFAGERIVEVLLKYGADVNAHDKTGNTALHFACSACDDSVGTLSHLVNSGADLRPRNLAGATPADLALSKGFRDAAEFIQEYTPPSLSMRLWKVTERSMLRLVKSKA